MEAEEKQSCNLGIGDERGLMRFEFMPRLEKLVNTSSPAVQSAIVCWCHGFSSVNSQWEDEIGLGLCV